MNRASWDARTALFALAIALATVAVYAQAHNFEFVAYDDDLFVFENPTVASGLHWEGVAWAFSGRVGNWVPLTWLSHMLDCSLFGVDPGPQHLVNLALHLFNALALLWVLRRLTGSTVRSAIVAALFALHPLHVESVAWISERRDVLSGAFFILALHAYGVWVRRPGAARYLLVFATMALGLMAKSMLVTLPFVLLLLDFWPLGRLREEGARGFRAGELRARVIEKLPLFLLSTVVCAITFLVQQEAGAMSSLAYLTPMQRLENALVAIVLYLARTVWPSGLMFFYPFPPEPWPLWSTTACFALLGALTVSALRLRARAPYLIFGWLFYLVTLLPVIGLVQVGGQSMADRYTYLPLIGVFVAVVWGGHALVERWARKMRSGFPMRAVAAGTAGVWLAGLSVVAWKQVGTWRDDAALFGHALSIEPDHFQALHHWASGLIRGSRLDEAIELGQRALAIEPHNASAHNNLAVAYSKQGRVDLALPHYQTAIERDPKGHGARASYNLARAFHDTGDLARARLHYEAALSFDPAYAAARDALAALPPASDDLGSAPSSPGP